RFTEKDEIAFTGSTTVPVILDDTRAVYDSWEIALYLDEAYPSRPGLFASSESLALTQFFNQWTVRTVHPPILRAIVLDLYGHLHEKDRAYFRESREKRFGTTLESYGADRDNAVKQLREALAPLRRGFGVHPFISGKGPGFADYILFGAFQWARAVSPLPLLENTDPVYVWRRS